MITTGEHQPLKSRADTRGPSSEMAIAASGKLPAPTLDELCSDPEVCRRVGDLISAMGRRSPWPWF